MSIAPMPFFDTLACARRLTEAGVPEPQARAHAETQVELLRAALGHAQEGAAQSVAEAKATVRETDTKMERAVHEFKLDTQQLRGEVQELRAEVQELRAEVQGVKADMRERFAQVEGQLRLLHWMLATLIAGMAAIFVKLFWG